MLQSFFNSTSLPLLEKLAVFGERRHEVLAGNIANVDTPDYKTRDLPVEKFQQALQQAIAQRSAMAYAHPNSSGQENLDAHFPKELFQAVEAAAQNITFQDGGNRSIEHEVMELTKNAMMQNFAIEVMTAQMNLMETVISGRV